MKNRIIVLAACLLSAFTMMAQTSNLSVYLPNEWRNFSSSDTLLYIETDPSNYAELSNEQRYTWSKSRSIESDHFILFWDKGYGTNRPDELDATDTYYVDIEDLIAKCETFYQLNVNQLQFTDLSDADALLNKYKGIIAVNYTDGWICYGGGYDYTIPAIWLSPSTCKPVGQAVAHEIGHSFQYMCYSDGSKSGTVASERGFHSAVGSGATIWEQTAQWQSVQAYPELMFDQSIGLFAVNHAKAFSHEWMRYQSYWWLYYIQEKYGKPIVGQVWNYDTQTVLDFNQAYMGLRGIDAEEFYREYFDYALHIATWDLDISRALGENYIGVYAYNYVPLGGNRFQVAYSSVPQASGFNVIPLDGPECGTTVKTTFTALPVGSALADNDPKTYYKDEASLTAIDVSAYNSGFTGSDKRGFRLGYVALLSDGQRSYGYADKVYCKGSGEESVDVEFTVPENTERMWLVVAPAPSQYIQHRWDEDVTNDDQWPYQLQFDGTSILGYVSGDETPSDVTLTYDVTFAPDAEAYSGTTVTVSSEDVLKIAKALQISTNDIASKLVDWSATQNNGELMFYAANADGSLAASGSTANGYGHWFTSDGSVIGWGDTSYLFSEFTPSTFTFSIGQYPNRCQEGDNYTIRQALCYKNANGETGTAYFVFNITTTSATETVTEQSLNLNRTLTFDKNQDVTSGTTILSDGDIAAIAVKAGLTNSFVSTADNYVASETATTGLINYYQADGTDELNISFDPSTLTFTASLAATPAEAGSYNADYVLNYTDGTSSLITTVRFTVNVVSESTIDDETDKTLDLPGVVLTDDCSSDTDWTISGNTSGVLHYDTWSVDNGMSDNFMEYWIYTGNGTGLLSDATIKRTQITGLTPGTYTVSITATMCSEANNTVGTGTTFFANDKSVDLSTGSSGAGSFTGYNGTYTLEVEVGETGTLDVGFTVSSANYNWLGFKDLTVTQTEQSEVTLEPKQDDSYLTGLTGTVTVNRTFKPGYSTIALPFNVDDDMFHSVFGQDAYIAQFDGASEADGVTTLNFTNSDQIVANRPYIIYVPEQVESPTFTDVVIYKEAPCTITSGLWSMTSNYTVGKSMYGLYGVANNATIMIGGPSSTLNGMAAFLTYQGSTDTKVHLIFSDETTGEATRVVDTIETINAATAGIYNISGARIQSPTRGINIIRSAGGQIRKVLVK